MDEEYSPYSYMSRTELEGFRDALNKSVNIEIAIQMLALLFAAKTPNLTKYKADKLSGFLDGVTEYLVNAGHGLIVLDELDQIRRM